VRSTTLSNTVNNSISSIKVIKNTKTTSKTNFFNSFKQNTYLKEYIINQKMHLNKKNTNITNNLTKNKKPSLTNFPFDLLNKSNNRYKKYQYKNRNKMNQSNYINNYINNSKNTKTTKKTNNKSNITNINNKPKLMNNNLKNKKQMSSFANSNISNSVSYLNTSKINKINKMKKIQHGVNPINTYIINTLNVSEKEFLNTGISSAKPGKAPNEQNKDLQNEINILIKEKEEGKNLIKKQKKLIEKFEEDNDLLENRINIIIQENKKIKEKIKQHLENQEQLVMLVKIVKNSGVDVESLIDKWNDEVDNMNNEEEYEMSYNKESSISDEINELNGKIDPSSFIPINIEEPHINKKVFSGIPKLNFSNINNRESNKKQRRKNNSK